MNNANAALAPLYRHSGPVIAHRVRINGRTLEEVGTFVEGETTRESVSTVTFKRADIQVFHDGAAVILRIPSRLALQLYFDGVLPTDGSPIELEIGHETAGSFRIEWQRQVAKTFRRPESVLLRLAKI